MFNIFIITLVVAVVFILLMLSVFFTRKKNNKPQLKESGNIERVYDNTKDFIYNSELDFDKLIIKDRSYLITFINDINPKLPNTQRLEKEFVDVISYKLNQKFYKTNNKL